ncbi:MAG: efflux RND transporter periplasmic adaptor subunit, partial [Spirochaetales bacterium]|nr:efflux RND transporter periplasmic adaptor subunit [Spirochaetales bacterium]MCF7939964.1 efflux RND transporter periplasmic adaptor subunit [Spirochaetales bacterium]
SDSAEKSAQAGNPPASRPPAAGSPASSPATAVEVHTLAAGTVSRYIKTNGEVRPASVVEVYSDVAGKVVRFEASKGNRVQKGDPIAAVDPSQPGQLYSTSTVTAPIDGTVTSLPLSRGDTVSGQTPIAVISDLSVLTIETYVPERSVGYIRRGLTAELSFPAFPGKTFQASVSDFSPVLDSASRTLDLELRFIGREEGIRVGMFADIHLVLEQRSGVPVLPREALVDTASGPVVFVITGRSEKTAEQRRVELGLEGRDVVEVVEGLEEGDQVIIKGQTFLEDGDPVRVLGEEQS